VGRAARGERLPPTGASPDLAALIAHVADLVEGGSSAPWRSCRSCSTDPMLLWAAQRQTRVADRAAEQALAAIEPIGRVSEDYRMLEVWVLALLQLRRPDDALPVVRKLQGMGYRNPAFLQHVKKSGLRLVAADPSGGR
jgi:hypothetical protein